MSLLRLVWGGSIYDSNTVATNPIEIWSCSLSVIGPSSPDTWALGNQLMAALEAYHEHADTGIDKTCGLEWAKFNEFDPNTGLQITDPSTIFEFAAGTVRGGVTPTVKQPITLSYKVSIDDGTRNPRARGGWYVPRIGAYTDLDARWAAAGAMAFALRAKTFLDAVNAVTGLTPGVWSRTDGTVTACTRVRVGRRPDTQRKRGNDLAEQYQTVFLA